MQRQRGELVPIGDALSVWRAWSAAQGSTTHGGGPESGGKWRLKGAIYERDFQRGATYKLDSRRGPSRTGNRSKH